jgi:hypothetical protein
MALFGLFGAFVFLVIAEIALFFGGKGDGRPAVRALFFLTLLEAGGAGPSSWLHVAWSVATGLL